MTLTYEEKLKFIKVFESEFGVRMEPNDELLPIMYIFVTSMRDSLEIHGDTQKIMQETKSILEKVDKSTARQVIHLDGNGAKEWQNGIYKRHRDYVLFGLWLLAFFGVIYYFFIR